MEHQIHLTTLSQAEDPLYERFRRARDRFFAPLCAFLSKMGVKPDHLNYLNLLLVIPLVYFLVSNPLVSLIFLILSFLLDALDGCLARYQHISSERGALLDIGVDHFILFSVVLALIFTKTLDGFWGSAYVLNYLLLIVLIMTMRALQMHVFFVI